LEGREQLRKQGDDVEANGHAALLAGSSPPDSGLQ
jgi:hypothetical protein